MKLVTYDEGRVGKLEDGQVVELDVPDMRTYFELGAEVGETGRRAPLEDARLRAPIIPKKFFHTAGNFTEHHDESTRVNWSHPVLPWIVSSTGSWAPGRRSRPSTSARRGWRGLTRAWPCGTRPI